MLVVASGDDLLGKITRRSASTIVHNDRVVDNADDFAKVLGSLLRHGDDKLGRHLPLTTPHSNSLLKNRCRNQRVNHQGRVSDPGIGHRKQSVEPVNIKTTPGRLDAHAEPALQRRFNASIGNLVRERPKIPIELLRQNIRAYRANKVVDVDVIVPFTIETVFSGFALG